MKPSGRRDAAPRGPAGRPAPADGSPSRRPDEAAELAGLLRDGAHRLGRTLQEAQVDRLLTYLALLAKWNAVYNLTSIREPRRMVATHLLDCLAAMRELEGLGACGPDRSGNPDAPAGPIEVLDVGSGAGLPGLVWAALDASAEGGPPDVDRAVAFPPAASAGTRGAVAARTVRRYTLIDAVEKKAAFQRQAVGELGLPDVQCLHGRVEAWHGGPFHVIASRAYATLAQFVAQTGHLLAEGGWWFAMKGAVPHDEIADLPTHVALERVVALDVPGLDGAARCVVLLRRR